MGENDDLLKDFLTESAENLEHLDQEFLALERGDCDAERLGRIFRLVHTLKGNSGFFGFDKLQGLAHAGETLLSKLRDGTLGMSPEKAGRLLAMVDGIRALLCNIGTSGAEGDVDYHDLATDLLRLAGGGETSTAKPSVPETGQITRQEAAPAAVAAGEFADVPAVAASAGRVAEAKPVPGKTGDETRRAVRQAVADPASDTIRVHVDLLDSLMNLVGKLVLTRNRIVQNAGSVQDAQHQAMVQSLSRLVTELQQGVMKTRMQPIGTLWNKLPRIVRDLAVGCGKKVRVQIEGEETELDRSLIEAIKDPMTHIVRNAVDHGVESPEDRRSAGKPEEGLLLFRAGQESGQVVLEIRDDGKGIDSERVKAKAVEKGMITAERAAKLSPAEALELIFLPGLSTAAKVTNVSGRGVGMDVVKTNIERMGGRIELKSAQGQGTTLIITIPLTLAIIPCLLVAAAGSRFAIPQVNLVELVQLEGEQATKGIETIYGAQFHRLRGRLLPLVYLNRILGLPLPEKVETVKIAVIQANGNLFGLVVDEILDSEEIVVKPLGEQLKGIPFYAGATILGDGRLALILDVLGVGREAHVLGKEAQSGEAQRHAATAGDKESLLLFQSPDLGQMVIPLARIARLEEIAETEIEHLGDNEVVQHRGSVIPILRVFQIVPERRRELRKTADEEANTGRLDVVIHTAPNGRTVGLVIGRILDTVDEAMALQRGASRPFMTGCLVIRNKVTEVLDVPALVRSVVPDFYDTPAIPAGPAPATGAA